MLVLKTNIKFTMLLWRFLNSQIKTALNRKLCRKIKAFNNLHLSATKEINDHKDSLRFKLKANATLQG